MKGLNFRLKETATVALIGAIKYFVQTFRLRYRLRRSCREPRASSSVLDASRVPRLKRRNEDIHHKTRQDSARGSASIFTRARERTGAIIPFSPLKAILELRILQRRVQLFHQLLQLELVFLQLVWAEFEGYALGMINKQKSYALRSSGPKSNGDPTPTKLTSGPQTFIQNLKAKIPLRNSSSSSRHLVLYEKQMNIDTISPFFKFKKIWKVLGFTTKGPLAYLALSLV